MRLAMRLLVALLATLGMLGLTAAPSSAQEEVALGVSVSSVTFDARTGTATVTGTVTCSEPLPVNVSGQLTQEVGRVSTVSGFFYTEVYCEGPGGTQFTATVYPYNGQFRGGKARLDLYAFGCVYDPETGYCIRFGSAQLTTTVQLHR